MRARMAIAYSEIPVELREVKLREMPAVLLAASPKATVPVLVLPTGEVIDESLDIMYWAVQQNDPDHWWGKGLEATITALVSENDNEFKAHLDHYKYADHHPEIDAQVSRTNAMQFLDKLEARLAAQPYLCGRSITLADIAIFPFVRQFSMVDATWFAEQPLPKLQHWLKGFLEGALFNSVMQKYAVWQAGDSPIAFP